MIENRYVQAVVLLVFAFGAALMGDLTPWDDGIFYGVSGGAVVAAVTRFLDAPRK